MIKTYFVKSHIGPELRIVFNISQEQLVVLPFLNVFPVHLLYLFACWLFSNLCDLFLPKSCVLLLVLRVNWHLVLLFYRLFLFREMLQLPEPALLPIAEFRVSFLDDHHIWELLVSDGQLVNITEHVLAQFIS